MTSPQRGDSFTHPDGRRRFFALVPCAGSGSRSGASGPKQYEELAGRALVLWTLEALARVDELDGTLVVLSPGDTQFAALSTEGDAEAAAACWRANVGGASRAESVFAGLHDLLARGAQAADWVLVHDAARCLIRPEAIRRLIAECRDDAVGGLLALPVADTLKRADADGRVETTVSRDAMWAAQTPQMFRIGTLRDALGAAFSRRDAAITDEASAIEATGQSPRLVRGDFDNIKVTWPEDFALAERLLHTLVESLTMTVPFRIGEGWDTHQLVEGRPLILGGVTIPHAKGLLGHSDADALCHAITDALFGAAGLGDIGRHFPDTDARFKGADSIALLVECAKRVRAAGWEPVNVDSTIVAQAPKMAPHIAAMAARIADALGIDASLVNVKAKTAEKMGPVGEGRAIETRAVCLVQRIEIR